MTNLTFWDFCAPFYDVAERTNGKAYANMLCIIRDLIPDGASVLEVAGGTGSISISIADKATHIICSDLSETMLKVSKRKAEKSKIKNISFQRCDIFNTEFKNNSFDVVIASQVLHLLKEPTRAVFELQRISNDIVILPVCLLSDISHLSRLKVNSWKLLGFKPRREFDAKSYRAFLEEIGAFPHKYVIADGAMPLAIAVWKK